MSQHIHPEFVDGCYRCELGLEEMREYEDSTPTTEEVEEMFVDLPPGHIEGSVESQRFRRWLSSDRRRAKAEAWDEGYDAGIPDGKRLVSEYFIAAAPNPYRADQNELKKQEQK